MSTRVTQWDVARLAGVSRATVSNVISDRSGGAVPISEETRQRVLAAVAELGYRPDARARSLRSGRSRTVGLVIPDAANPHFWAVVRGVEEAVRRQGCQLVLAFTALDPERERQSLHALAERRMDGLILMLTYPGRVRSELEALRLRGGAIVALGGTLPGHDALFCNYAAGTADLMRHLMSLGHRRIAFVHGTARPGLGADRLQAYRRALHAAGLPVDRRLIGRCGSSLTDGVAAA
ncbi:MAG: LacI family DNA-binding transcriptional regulator, partial [Anaerolineae bacterium]